jgi:hypothetical protein
VKNVSIKPMSPVTVQLSEQERVFLVRQAAERSMAAGRPVSVSRVVRDLIERVQREDTAA